MLHLALSLAPALLIHQDAPASRALSLELCKAPRLAGTPSSLHAVESVSRALRAAGWEVELDRREVLLSLPRRLEVSVLEDAGSLVPEFERIWTYDPDARPPGDLPPFNAWTASGTATGEVVDVGYGSRADFERLLAGRVKVSGAIALCRYGKGYRGIKVALAEEYGCVGMLLFTPRDVDGDGRGPVWPEGPWKPDHEAQRGAVGPMTEGPGDPTTPGWASPAPGVEVERRWGEELDAFLPGIPVQPIGAADAERIISSLSRRRLLTEDGTRKSSAIGPGPVAVRMTIDAPRELRSVVNVVGTLPGRSGSFVMAGNHRDAWVRGARDAASGTVTLLRAAQHLGERARGGWLPEHGVRLAFWDAEESGLLGSTEWGEAFADSLRTDCVAYINGDAVVGGLQLNVSGTPGLEDALERALDRVPEPVRSGSPPTGRTIGEARRERLGDRPELGLPGSGSDFAVFLHHLGLPVLDITMSGVPTGEYHTAFDDFLLMDRFVDPDWVAHETAGHVFAELLAELAEGGFDSFDDATAARELGRHAREAGEALGEELALELAGAFEELASAIDGAAEGRAPARLLQALEHTPGLDGRPWFKNQLWAPGLETGYGSETFPRIRLASDGEERRLATDQLLEQIAELTRAWSSL